MESTHAECTFPSRSNPCLLALLWLVSAWHHLWLCLQEGTLLTHGVHLDWLHHVVSRIPSDGPDGV